MPTTFKNETLTQEDFEKRCNDRIRYLEDLRMNAFIDETSPTSAPASGAAGMGLPPVAIDPATGLPMQTPDADGEKSRVERLTDEIDALKALRDSYKVK